MIKARTVELMVAVDARGVLAVAEYPCSLPFLPRRVFVVTQNSPGVERGGHAHRTCHQVLLAPSGSVLVELDDDDGTRSVVLGEGTVGLYIPPLVWARQTYESRESSLVVLASHEYDVKDYVDDRSEARMLRQSNQT